ncbi:MAG: hypothetical protein J3R72DRAFT_428805 [Linnemannia gamsii]|nr:MAG: hypothetical protein J3R72DRAFT_428805 [Linnemannia gamsii]
MLSCSCTLFFTIVVISYHHQLFCVFAIHNNYYYYYLLLLLQLLQTFAFHLELYPKGTQPRSIHNSHTHTHSLHVGLDTIVLLTTTVR